METKSRYEIISELETKKRDLIFKKSNIHLVLRQKEKEVKAHERVLEEKKEELEDYKSRIEDEKEMFDQLIASIDDSLQRIQGQGK